jgi:putative DNA primase/helicase
VSVGGDTTEPSVVSLQAGDSASAKGTIKKLNGEVHEFGELKDVGAPEFSDEDLARRFTVLHANEFRFVAGMGRWFRWDGHRWREDDTLDIFTEVRRVNAFIAASAKGAEAKGITSGKTVAAVERLLRAEVTYKARADEWDANAWILNTPNGIRNLQTGEWRKVSPDDMVTKITSVSPAAGPHPNWTEFLEWVTCGDQELQSYLKRVAGYVATGSTREHAMFFFYGPGGNGKGTFLRTLMKVLGDYGITSPIETFISAERDRHPTEIARLRSARLVITSETEEGRRWAEARIKELTGGDRISARFMRQDFFDFDPHFKLLVSGNHKPGLKTVDAAIRRRFNLIPFAASLPLDAHGRPISDPDYESRFAEELPAILQWVVDGALEYQADGLSPPAVVRKATDEYLSQEDAIALWIEECCDAGEKCAINALYRSYRNWAEQSNEFRGSKKWLSQKLDAKHFQRYKSGNERGFNGLTLKSGTGFWPDEQ